MKQIERLDEAIGTLLRVLTIDERRLSFDLETVPFNPLDLETLSYLHRHPASAAKDIANYLGVRSTTMQSVVDRLQKRGLLKRDNFALKGRAIALTLTQEGMKLRQRIHDQNLKNCQKMLQCIAKGERGTFIQHMTRIADTFSRKKGTGNSDPFR